MLWNSIISGLFYEHFIKVRFSEFYISCRVNIKYLTRILLTCLIVYSTMLIVRTNQCYIKRHCMLLEHSSLIRLLLFPQCNKDNLCRGNYNGNDVLWEAGNVSVTYINISLQRVNICLICRCLWQSTYFKADIFSVHFMNGGIVLGGICTHMFKCICIQEEVQMKCSFQYTGTWSVASWLSRRLCYRSAVAFRYLRLCAFTTSEKTSAHVWNMLLLQFSFTFKLLYVRSCITLNV